MCGWVSVCVGDGGVGKEIIVSRSTVGGHVDVVCGERRDRRRKSRRGGYCTSLCRPGARSLPSSSMKIVVVVGVVVRPLNITSPTSPAVGQSSSLCFFQKSIIKSFLSLFAVESRARWQVRLKR